MLAADPRVDAYIADRVPFARPILTHIRAHIHAVCPDVEETIKWGMPFFVYAGRPMANMAAFKAHAALGFWDRSATNMAQASDAMGQYGRLTSIADLPDDGALDDRVREAMAVIDAGHRPKRAIRAPKPEAEVPPALAAALAGDAAARATFHAFPPSSRREYCDWIAEAKRDETRARRVAETIDWLREGKRRSWKYENC